MPTPLNASSLYKSQIRDIVYGTVMRTVGVGADYEALNDATSVSPDITELTDITCSAAGVGDRFLDVTTGSLAAYSPRADLVIKIPASGTRSDLYVRCVIWSSTRLELKRPLTVAVTEFTLCSIEPVVIALLPGVHTIDISSGGIVGFGHAGFMKVTSMFGKGSAIIREIGTGTEPLFKLGTVDAGVIPNTNELIFDNLVVMADQRASLGAHNCFEQYSTRPETTMIDYEVNNCDIYHGSQGIIGPQGSTDFGGMPNWKITNNKFKGSHRMVSLCSSSSIIFKDNHVVYDIDPALTLSAYNYGLEVSAGDTSDSLGLKFERVIHNNIFDIRFDGTEEISAIRIARGVNNATTDSYISIQGNTINVDNAGTGDTFGITADTETNDPTDEIFVRDNQFSVTGTNKWDLGNRSTVNLDIRSVGNHRVDGGALTDNGGDVVALTTG